LVAPDVLEYSAAEGESVDVVVSRNGASLDRALSVSYQTVAGSADAADFTPVSGTLAWAPGDPAEKAITIPLTADALAEGQENLSLHLSDLSGPATFPASDPTQTVTIAILDHPFDQWRIDHFAADANFPVAASTADYEADGVANLLEYVFQTDPVEAMDAAVLPQGIIQDGRFGVRLVCLPSPGVRLEVQKSTTLDLWEAAASRSAGSGEWDAEDPEFLISSGPSEGEIRVMAPAGAVPMYLRLAAIRN
jgi:Calx-beta domain